MAIVCTKCKYVMNEMQIIGYVLSDAYDIAKIIAPIIILNHYGLNPKEFFGYKNNDSFSTTNNIESPAEHESKRSYIESSILRFFNEQKVNCPSCLKYKGWINIEEDVIEEDREAE